jgi:2-succinyl-6-hydroxy-2,4-cyclohexadiene-1-carboxylate synthase
MAPTVVLLHGFTHTGASWDPVVAALGERYRALAPDIRGHGSAADARPVSLAAVIGDIRRVAPPRFTLAGYSMGGRIALHAALALPSRVERLILIGASPGIGDRHERRQRRQADERLAGELEALDIEALAERWARETAVVAEQPERVRTVAHADRLRNSPPGLAQALRQLGPGALPPVWRRLAQLPMPVTLVVGRRDEKFQAIAARMAGAIPRARTVSVPEAGHAVHLEAPGTVAEIIAGDTTG